jgi:polysaccharide export outer membrane protein
LDKVTLPRYVIEPPDILLIEGVKLVPKSPHRIETFDVLLIRVTGTLPEAPIGDSYPVDADGSVNLGPPYGRIKLVGLTIEEAEDEVHTQLSQQLTDVDVSISLIQAAGAQAISGQHLVGLDGRVNLATYGPVYVAGMTLEEARDAIEERLSLKLDDPEVFVDVLAYNSKAYYVVTEGGGFGDNVVKLPITGNETVLDAVANIGGISQISSSNNMWIARPAPNGLGCEQILPVNWHDITQGASTATNYQLMPGDRLFIAENKYSRATATVSNLLRPFESIFGFASLGTSTINRIIRLGLGNTF